MTQAKTLVILVHPNLEQSRINRRLAAAAAGLGSVTVHDLYRHYPDFRVDVEKEQELLLAHERVVFQFPFYWYSAPALLKQWLDEVLTYGWAYGSGGDKLHGKEFGLALSTGGPQEAYQAGGYNRYAISELTKPFQATSNLIGMRFLPSFVLNGVRTLPEEQLELAAGRYAEYLTK